MSLSTTLRNALANLAFGGTSWTPPATIYLGASTADPGADGSTTVEPAGGGYSRVAVTNNVTNFPAASGGTKRNAAAITFPMASAPWGVVTHLVVYTALSGGTFLGGGALVTPRSVNIGDILRVDPDELELGIAP